MHWSENKQVSMFMSRQIETNRSKYINRNRGKRNKTPKIFEKEILPYTCCVVLVQHIVMQLWVK